MTSLSSSDTTLSSSLRENRVFPPPEEFAAKAHVKNLAEYEALYARSVSDPDGFWNEVAQELHWFKPWEKTLEWDLPWAKWFVGGKTNLSYNCLDRHVENGKKDKVAILWEGEPGEVRKLTYGDLLAQVEKFANVLKSLGIRKGDRVAIYMGMAPELAVALLACARIGAVHSVIFGGFAANAIVDRVNDAQCVAVITQDTSFRRGSQVKLKATVDEALPHCPSVKNVVVYRRSGADVTMQAGRDHWWHELAEKVEDRCPAEELDSEDPLYILYTSGTTGKPKGLVHTTGGYAVGTYLTSKLVFDLRDDDVYWCSADIGWVTGHSYVVYGPLQNGVTVLMYEGAPNCPDYDRFWKIIDQHKVTVFYTAPTAIRAFIKWGDQYPLRYDLSSLRLLGTVGEPINPEAWMWYRDVIGKGRCPIVDTWWQTETGAIMISPLPGAVAAKPGSATRPFPGIVPEIVTKEGEPVPAGHGGLLVIRRPWPSMARTIYNDPERYKQAYWTEVPGSYFTGDGARKDEDGYFWLMGRVDDVINVSGHRLGTMEIESALVAHPKVAEAAVVGRPDELKGQGIAAFVTLESGNEPTAELREELRKWVAKEIGALARPDDLRFTEQLPKTRSGKIMRRLLRELATHGEIKGDTTTLEDFSVLAKLREQDE
ncbi:acetate--CoA ligase [Silvibacterium dinghuense]|uniref:Acetyl-coenzyme A synthetase n=1 Tax=Silvibacterium dinghuense TaxID=1560006 RepID=A0A4Q1SES4_9BACT|nr:acetate--CoA ligase [Silvibacterium dinghuense]RXS95633.1 acetate--CoA ligase [Silvibacterium dinghuense]GGH14554.1 acetyl-coenzyme A synthetase [Silvibacterium dinghuense]